MPAAVAVKGAIVVITVVAGIAIAVYESPQVREFAEDCRRRIAVALQSLGDDINPNAASGEPRFNRPEDAQGFMRSTAEAGVDADEASKRRQREELMYWNQIKLEKLEQEKKRQAEEKEEKKKSMSRGSSFDEFLQEDETGEKGTFVYNSGADTRGNLDQGLYQRRGQGVRGLDYGAVAANPFADENGIEMEVQHAVDKSLMSPERSEFSEDLYGAEDDIKPTRASTQTLVSEEQEQLVDLSEPPTIAVAQQPVLESYDDAYMTAGQDDPESAYASIHAWADNSRNASFYSPLPVTPQAAMSEASEPEILSGQITPTDSASLAGSGEDVGNENASSVGDNGRYYDVISEDGISTPGSWTEVGSVVSENDAGHHH